MKTVRKKQDTRNITNQTTKDNQNQILTPKQSNQKISKRRKTIRHKQKQKSVKNTKYKQQTTETQDNQIHKRNLKKTHDNKIAKKGHTVRNTPTKQD